MDVKCRCGQAFTVYPEQFPHGVHCFACGVRFMVLENGTTDEIRAKPVEVMCRCGKAYSIHAVEFPRRLHCIQCNRKFSVLDTGEWIDDDAEASAPSTGITAAVSESTFTNIESPVAIQDFAARSTSASSAPPDERLEGDLRLIDLQWKHERMGHALIDLAGFTVFPSRSLAVLLAVGWLSFVAVAMMIVQVLLAPMCSGCEICSTPALLGLACGPVHVYSLADALEKAEIAWRERRLAVVRDHELKRRLMSIVASIDRCENAD